MTTNTLRLAFILLLAAVGQASAQTASAPASGPAGETSPVTTVPQLVAPLEKCEPQPACWVFSQKFNFGHGVNGLKAGSTVAPLQDHMLVYQRPAPAGDT